MKVTLMPNSIDCSVRNCLLFKVIKTELKTKFLMFDIEGKFVWTHCSGWKYLDDRRSKLVEDLSLQGKVSIYFPELEINIEIFPVRGWKCQVLALPAGWSVPSWDSDTPSDETKNWLGKISNWKSRIRFFWCDHR